MQNMNLAVTVEVQEEPITLPEAQAVLLFQSVRELLINASKYSGTGHATVRLNVIEEHLTIEVQDQGAGFDLHAATAPALPSGDLSSRFGLFSIRERMIALGGSLEMHSAVGKGTHAILRLPSLDRPHQARPHMASGRSQSRRNSVSPAIVGAREEDTHSTFRW